MHDTAVSCKGVLRYIGKDLSIISAKNITKFLNLKKKCCIEMKYDIIKLIIVQKNYSAVPEGGTEDEKKHWI